MHHLDMTPNTAPSAGNWLLSLTARSFSGCDRPGPAASPFGKAAALTRRCFASFVGRSGRRTWTRNRLIALHSRSEAASESKCQALLTSTLWSLQHVSSKLCLAKVVLSLQLSPPASNFLSPLLCAIASNTTFGRYGCGPREVLPTYLEPEGP